MHIYATGGWNNNKQIKIATNTSVRRSAAEPVGQFVGVRVRTRAARRAAWAGSGWTGVSVEPCDPAAASPARSARRTSAGRCASSGGRRTCCSRSPRCAPWTCSSGCTSPVSREEGVVGCGGVKRSFLLCCVSSASKWCTKVNVCCEGFSCCLWRFIVFLNQLAGWSRFKNRSPWNLFSSNPMAFIWVE